MGVLGWTGVWDPWNRRGYGCKDLGIDRAGRVAAGGSQDKARDFTGEWYGVQSSAAADIGSKWNLQR